VLASDRAIEAQLESQQAPAVIEIGFVKNGENEPYGMMPITGFVDDGKTSWRVVRVGGMAGDE
jgi:hypothetical protein